MPHAWLVSNSTHEIAECQWFFYTVKFTAVKQVTMNLLNQDNIHADLLNYITWTALCPKVSQQTASILWITNYILKHLNLNLNLSMPHLWQCNKVGLTNEEIMFLIWNTTVKWNKVFSNNGTKTIWQWLRFLCSFFLHIVQDCSLCAKLTTSTPVSVKHWVLYWKPSSG